MKNNIDGGDWNTDAMATSDMTCDQVARYLTAFSSAFRAFIMASHRDENGLARLVALNEMLSAQIAMIKASPELFDKDTVENGMMAIGMAIAASTGKDPAILGRLAVKAAETIVMLIEKNPDKYDTSHIHYVVRNSEGEESVGMGKLQIGVKLIPMEELVEQLKKDEASSGVLKLLNSKHQDHGDD